MLVSERMLVKSVRTEKHDTYLNTFKASIPVVSHCTWLAENGRVASSEDPVAHAQWQKHKGHNCHRHGKTASNSKLSNGGHISSGTHLGAWVVYSSIQQQPMPTERGQRQWKCCFKYLERIAYAARSKHCLWGDFCSKFSSIFPFRKGLIAAAQQVSDTVGFLYRLGPST